MLKHIIFDFDGTIADSTEIGLQIFNELSEKYNYKKLSKNELFSLNNKSIKERLKLIGVPYYKLPQFIMDAMAKYRLLINSLKTFEGIRNLIISLKEEGYTLSIISSNSVENIKHFLQKYELEYFNNIISGNNLFGKNKVIKNFLKKFKLKVDEIIYIGDELRDIQACKKASVKIISVIWGFDSIELLKRGNPDYISYKPEDIIEIVKNLRC